MKKKMKKYDGMDTYGAPTKKEKFKKFIRRMKEMKIGEKAKKLYNKTVIPDKIKAYKEKKKFIRETRQEAMKEARKEMKDTMKERFKKEELAKLNKPKGNFMNKLAQGFDTGDGKSKDDMSKKILDGFSMGGEQNKNDMSKKILDGFSMGSEQNKDNKIGNMMSGGGIASDEKLKKMLGQEQSVEKKQLTKEKKKENFEDKIKRLLE